MKIFTRDKKLEASLTNEALCKKHFGPEMCKKIMTRIRAIVAAESLADFWPPFSLPERCHELKGKEAGIFSMDVKQPYRLLFEPIVSEAELPTSQATQPTDQQERWRTIKSVELLRVEDTHG